MIVVDSYEHRNISRLQAYATVCTGMHLWGRDRAGDLYAMMEWVRRQGWADPTPHRRGGLEPWRMDRRCDGMSLKPGAEMANATKLSGMPDEPMAGLVGAFVVYPYCGIGVSAAERGTRMDMPVKALVGTSDVIVGGKGLAKTLQKMKTPKSAIEVMHAGRRHARVR